MLYTNRNIHERESILIKSCRVQSYQTYKFDFLVNIFFRWPIGGTVDRSFPCWFYDHESNLGLSVINYDGVSGCAA